MVTVHQEGERYLLAAKGSPAELLTLFAPGADAVSLIDSLARGRRFLDVDNPKGGPQRIGWVDGGSIIGPHD